MNYADDQPTHPLKTIFKEIISNTAVDYGVPEMKDISSAVEELAQRYVQQFNKTSFLHIDRIQPCGSMVEKTSLWKSCSVFQGPREHDINYLEFDYLAVLEKPWNCMFKKGCSNCLRITTNYGQVMDSSDDDYPSDDVISPAVDNPFHNFSFDASFHSELHSTIASLCNCYKVKKGNEDDSDYRRTHKYTETYGMHRKRCHKCTVYRNTGCLCIGSTEEARYLSKDTGEFSFLLMWKSSANSLFASHSKTLRRSEPIQLLHIFVDFLPAFEVKRRNGSKRNLNANFVVPKNCNLCERYKTWRGSNCLSEVNAVRFQLSDHHKRCYVVMKCIIAQVKSSQEFFHFIPKGYHVKCAILNHNKQCSLNDGDYSKCILKVLQDLKSAYQDRYLKAFIDDSSLIEDDRPETLMQGEVILTGIIEALTQVRMELIEWKTGHSCPYSPEKVIRRIVKTVEGEIENQPPFEH